MSYFSTAAETVVRSMQKLSDREPWVSYTISLLIIAVTVLGGGGSRGDIKSLIFLRPTVIVLSAILLIMVPRASLRSVKVPLLLLGLLTLYTAFQLIPLPPQVWMALPGQAVVAEAYIAAGIDLPWRPVSLAPDLTLNSLVSFSIPAAGLIAAASLNRQHLSSLVAVMIVVGLLSAILATAQLTGGLNGPFYLYAVTNEGSAVGLFANRNHQAAFLACCFPLLAAWVANRAAGDPDLRRVWLAFFFSLLLLPMLLITGSRAGLALAALAVVLAAASLRRPAANSDVLSRFGAWRRAILILPIVIAVIVLGAAVYRSRAEALTRIFAANAADDERLSNLPLLVRMAVDFLPLGSGQGTFDRLFRIYEPEERLRPTYLNHAHNDLLELLITGGLPALLILFAFLWWWGRLTWAAWRSVEGDSSRVIQARLGATVIGLLLLASLVDYPLRTPALALFFAIACVWLGRLHREEVRSRASKYRLDRQN